MPQFDFLSNYFILTIFYFMFFLGYITIYILINTTLKFIKSIFVITTHFNNVNNWELKIKNKIKFQENWKLLKFFKI